MRNFAKRMLLFTLFFFLLSIIILGFLSIKNGYSVEDMPPPNFSNSISFNEKIKFLRTKQREFEVIALGSSMTLNNISSKEIIDNFKGAGFLNVSSWGMSLKDDYEFLKVIGECYKPHTLILISNIVDFQDTEKAIDFNATRDYIKKSLQPSFYFHLKLFNLKYYLVNLSKTRIIRSKQKNFASLNFDEWGSVLLPNDMPKDSSRWMNDHLAEPVLEYQYSYLDSISKYCHSNSIELYLIQSPIRYGVVSSFSTKDFSLLSNHYIKVEAILKKHNQSFIRSDNVIWNDSLFSDAIHLNNKGANDFTNLFLKSITKRR